MNKTKQNNVRREMKEQTRQDRIEGNKTKHNKAK